ncbi:MAG: hypothetical protein HRT73_05945 [Flavobacteriales bacterium]|nr:hypothetical protein [Flavobacteriales bacterium]
MKKLLTILTILIAAAGCGEGKKDSHPVILDYIKWNTETNVVYREYQSRTDTTIEKVFISQFVKEIDDSTWDVQFSWIRDDSLPINRGIERYRSDNTVEIIEQSYFELDSLNNPIEVKAQIMGNNIFTLNKPDASVKLLYQFASDTSLTMLLSFLNNYTIGEFDSLDVKCQDCLILQATNKTELKYSDERQNTINHSESLGVFHKGKGLILFISKDKSDCKVYRLIE